MYPEGQNVLVVDHDPARRQSIERILAQRDVLMKVIHDELVAVRDAHKAPRRSVIVTDDAGTIETVALVEDEPYAVTVTARGYVRAVSERGTCVDPVLRREQVRRHREIRRRESKRAAALVAERDGPLHLGRPVRQSFRKHSTCLGRPARPASQRCFVAEPSCPPSISTKAPKRSSD